MTKKSVKKAIVPIVAFVMLGWVTATKIESWRQAYNEVKEKAMYKVIGQTQAYRAETRTCEYITLMSGYACQVSIWMTPTSEKPEATGTIFVGDKE